MPKAQIPVRAQIERLRRRVESGASLQAEELEWLLSEIEAAQTAVESSEAVKHDQVAEETGRRLLLLSQHLDLLDERVLRLENSRVFRYLQRASMALFGWKNRFRHRGGQGGTRIQHRDDQRDYERWVEREQCDQPSAGRIESELANWKFQPVFSILMRLENPDLPALETALHSLSAQSYTRWELCVCDDASADLSIGGRLQKWDGAPRLRYLRSEARMGEASSLNRAAMLAGGDYLVVMNAGQSLTPHALYFFAQTLQDCRYPLLYSDEDRIDGQGRRSSPLFKPDWSPDLLTSSMYLGRSFVVARETLAEIGGFSSEFDGGHLYDAALRLSERCDGAGHVPRVLLHSGAASDTQDVEAQQRSLEAACVRRGWEARVEPSIDGGSFHLRRKIAGTPLASIVICSRTPRLLENCLRSIDRKTAYPVREVIVVQHKTGHDDAMNRLLERSRCVRVSHTGPFDFSAMNNAGAHASSGQILVFLNDDVEPIEAGWLNYLLAEAQRPAVGVVGAKLVYPNGAIQHAGIALGMRDGTGHPGRGTLGNALWPWIDRKRNVSAVTGACLAVRRAVFDELNGFDRRFPVNYNDTDFCLRARARGYEVICEPSAVLRHYESSTRDPGVSWLERERWNERWHRLLEPGDPYYSRHLTRTREDCALDEE